MRSCNQGLGQPQSVCAHRLHTRSPNGSRTPAADVPRGFAVCGWLAYVESDVKYRMPPTLLANGESLRGGGGVHDSVDVFDALFHQSLDLYQRQQSCTNDVGRTSRAYPQRTRIYAALLSRNPRRTMSSSVRMSELLYSSLLQLDKHQLVSIFTLTSATVYMGSMGVSSRFLDFHFLKI